MRNKVYEPTIEEIKAALGNARAILEGIFPHVSDQDVAKFRELMKKRLNDYYAKNGMDDITIPSKDKVKECKSALIGYKKFHSDTEGNTPRTEFGKKFKEKYGKMNHTDRSVYDKEKHFYKVHGYCSWEQL